MVSPISGKSPADHHAIEFNTSAHLPEFNRDPAKRIIWIDPGRRQSEVRGEDFKGGGAEIESYDGGRIGLATGAVITLKHLRLVKSLYGSLLLVEGD